MHSIRHSDKHSETPTSKCTHLIALILSSIMTLKNYFNHTYVYAHFGIVTDMVCYQFFLLYFYSRANGLCMTAKTKNSNGTIMRDLSIRLLVNDINHQYFPYSGKFESDSVDNSYTFSCTKDPRATMALVTVKGYDIIMRDEWRSTIKIIVEGDCFKSKGIC